MADGASSGVVVRSVKFACMVGQSLRCSRGGSLPSVDGPVDGDEGADSVGGVVAGSGEWAGCVPGLGVGGLIVMRLDSLGSDLVEYQGSLLC